MCVVSSLLLTTISQLIRKLLLTGLLVYLPPATRAAAATLVCVIAVANLNYFQPHQNRLVFWVANVSFFFTTCKYLVTLLGATVLGQQGKEAGSSSTAACDSNSSSSSPAGGDGEDDPHPEEDALAALLIGIDVAVMVGGLVALCFIVVLLRRDVRELHEAEVRAQAQLDCAEAERQRDAKLLITHHPVGGSDPSRRGGGGGGGGKTPAAAQAQVEEKSGRGPSHDGGADPVTASTRPVRRASRWDSGTFSAQSLSKVVTIRKVEGVEEDAERSSTEHRRTVAKRQQAAKDRVQSRLRQRQQGTAKTAKKKSKTAVMPVAADGDGEQEDGVKKTAGKRRPKKKTTTRTIRQTKTKKKKKEGGAAAVSPAQVGDVRAALAKVCKTPERLAKAFEKLDRDRSGGLDIGELKRFVASVANQEAGPQGEALLAAASDGPSMSRLWSAAAAAGGGGDGAGDEVTSAALQAWVFAPAPTVP